MLTERCFHGMAGFEQILAKIWAEAFGLQEIGIHDNFFDLGGDSIINIQITTQATQQGLFFTPKMLFENPTIASLATVVEMESSVVADQGLVTGPVPLTPIQHWFFEGEPANPHHSNQTMLVFGKSYCCFEGLLAIRVLPRPVQWNSSRIRLFRRPVLSLRLGWDRE